MITRKQLQEAVEYAFRGERKERRLVFMTVDEIELYESIVEEFDMDGYQCFLLRSFIINRGDEFYYPSKENCKLHLKKNEKGIIERVY